MKRTALLLAALLCAATGVMAQTKGARPEPLPTTKQEWTSALSRKIQRSVRMPLAIPGVSGPRTARVAFVVRKDGTISDVEIRESSGVPQVDANAREAILRMSPVAPFSSDMTGETENIVAPIRMEMVLPNPTVRDQATGLTFTTPAELQTIGKADPPGEDTVKYNLATMAPGRVPGTPDQSVCKVGFRVWEKDNPRYGWSQEKLNGDAMFDELAKPLRALMEEAGKRVEDTQTINLHSARGVEMILAPTSGPDTDTLRQYVVFADTPTGRISISCDISREATAAARPVFKLLAQTVQVVR